MSTQLQTLYKEASAFLTYIKMDAPDFSPEDKMTWEQGVDRIYEYIEEIRSLERNGSSLQWLELCLAQVNSAAVFFRANENSKGRKTLDVARNYLKNAMNKRAIKARIIAPSEGPGQDLESGFPT
jgi:hypothetical protein